MSEQAAAFAAVTAIEEGSWDRYLLRLQAAIRQRMATEAYKRHIIVGQGPGSDSTRPDGAEGRAT